MLSRSNFHGFYGTVGECEAFYVCRLFVVGTKEDILEFAKGPYVNDKAKYVIHKLYFFKKSLYDPHIAWAIRPEEIDDYAELSLEHYKDSLYTSYCYKIIDDKMLMRRLWKNFRWKFNLLSYRGDKKDPVLDRWKATISERRISEESIPTASNDIFYGFNDLAKEKNNIVKTYQRISVTGKLFQLVVLKDDYDYSKSFIFFKSHNNLSIHEIDNGILKYYDTDDFIDDIILDYVITNAENKIQLSLQMFDWGIKKKSYSKYFCVLIKMMTNGKGFYDIVPALDSDSPKLFSTKEEALRFGKEFLLNDLYENGVYYMMNHFKRPCLTTIQY